MLKSKLVIFGQDRYHYGARAFKFAAKSEYGTEPAFP